MPEGCEGGGEAPGGGYGGSGSCGSAPLVGPCARPGARISYASKFCMQRGVLAGAATVKKTKCCKEILTRDASFA